MRRLAPLLLAALVATSCGGGDDGLSKQDARAIARRAQLTTADLGAGWKQTSDEKPDGDGNADLERCIGTDLAVADDTLAESNTRTFEHLTTDVDQQQLVVSSAVLVSEERADELHRVIATRRFGDCMAKAFEQELKASEEGVTFQAGDISVSDGAVADADRSAHVVAPFKLQVEPLDLAGQVDLLSVSSGQAFSLVFGFSLGTALTKEEVTHLGDLLLRRQQPKS